MLCPFVTNQPNLTNEWILFVELVYNLKKVENLKMVIRLHQLTLELTKPIKKSEKLLKDR